MSETSKKHSGIFIHSQQWKTAIFIKKYSFLVQMQNSNQQSQLSIREVVLETDAMVLRHLEDRMLLEAVKVIN